MKYNPQNRTGRHEGLPVHAGLPQRKSIRLKGYDYSQAGLYFITICCKDRAHLFGHIENGEMILNDAGTMVEKWYNVGAVTVGADLRVCPNNANTDNDTENGQLRRIAPTGEQPISISGEQPIPISGEQPIPISGGNNISGEHTGSPLHRVVQWFKTMTTNEYIRGVKTLNWQPFNGKLWQRNYYEHIIRTENDYQRIAQYIINNPQKWITIN